MTTIRDEHRPITVDWDYGEGVVFPDKTAVRVFRWEHPSVTDPEPRLEFRCRCGTWGPLDVDQALGIVDLHHVEDCEWEDQAGMTVYEYHATRDLIAESNGLGKTVWGEVHLRSDTEVTG